jgi:hypothetical protein
MSLAVRAHCKISNLAPLTKIIYLVSVYRWWPFSDIILQADTKRLYISQHEFVHQKFWIYVIGHYRNWITYLSAITAAWNSAYRKPYRALKIFDITTEIKIRVKIPSSKQHYVTDDAKRCRLADNQIELHQTNDLQSRLHVPRLRDTIYSAAA